MSVAYIGTKVLLAFAMTRGEYNALRGWTPPEGEDQSVEGYKVEYQDGYISWSPKKQFDEAYQTLEAMNFSHALKVLNDGYRVQRAGWNGKGMWICKSPHNIVEAGAFWAPHNKAFAASRPDRSAEVLPYFTLKTADDKIVPWVASQTDLLANDWRIVT